MKLAGVSLVKAPFFPSKRAASAHYRYRALVGIGGNEGAVMERFVRLLRYWTTRRDLFVVETSPIVKNPPFGYLPQPDFLNALAWVQTSLSAKALLRLLLQTEKRFGRVRKERFGPRTLDLDLIFFENQTLNTPRLTLPHPHWSERLSVIVPLGMMQQRNVS
ncbi:2-amino-4-hydroxy-6-hydroxymethyldihydropteridine diphosphokinase [Sulfurospirillum sp. T05]|uniref:2-amino-4-hydroxy-6-hydroxymethyldihydropteridine pyrophosphokinase n=1 Tax=Sulfurospirillum tamanense TaxID=2813362 RepID=A0ABS2WPH7_9BACT|nr:2-amino-4-hydroxy-6-hydroxymethyldihydropteridine diphosphokinase [Sulfurospirillum tamanensis]MBN2963467.1 2-amino-4-hydroxy-6-hydroxymethyldihydropteridine diphosphokinase [Sulfurospirillum tamanensis]